MTLIGATLHKSEGEARENLLILQDLTRKLIEGQAMYRCSRCGSAPRRTTGSVRAARRGDRSGRSTASRASRGNALDWLSQPSDVRWWGSTARRFLVSALRRAGSLRAPPQSDRSPGQRRLMRTDAAGGGIGLVIATLCLFCGRNDHPAARGAADLLGAGSRSLVAAARLDRRPSRPGRALADLAHAPADVLGGMAAQRLPETPQPASPLSPTRSCSA
jgi:hypothetical protein